MPEVMDRPLTEETIAKAGRRPEGWYLFEIRGSRRQDVEGGVSQRTGKPYDAFTTFRLSLAPKGQAVYDEQGTFAETRDTGGYPLSLDLSDKGRGLETFKKAYKMATGHDLSPHNYPSQTQSYLDEMVGGQLWGRIYHRKLDSGDYAEEIDGKRFRSTDYGPPATVTVRA